MQTLERATALLRGATSFDGLANILRELGFAAPPLPLDDRAALRNGYMEVARSWRTGDCLELGVIDGIVPEPAGGAQESPDEAARLLRDALVGALEELGSLPPDERRRRRRRKFREMGVYA